MKSLIFVVLLGLSLPMFAQQEVAALTSISSITDPSNEGDGEETTTETATRNKLLIKADKYFETLAYSKAIKVYEKALEKEQDVEAMLRLAESYRLTNAYKQAEPWYAKAIQNGADDPEMILHYAQMLQSNWKTTEAIEWFEYYKTMQPEDQRADRFLLDCKRVLELVEDSALYLVQNLAINSEFSDFGPSFYKSGVAFVSERPSNYVEGRTHTWTDKPFIDFYFSEGRQGQNEDWKVFARSLNSSLHEGPMSITEAGDVMYFTRNNLVDRQQITDKDGNIKLKILQSTINENGKWGKPEELPFNSDDYTVAHPSLSPDELTMYFSSDMPGGYGKSDIYVTHFVNGQWGPPINLGPLVNTAGEESFPVCHSKDELYFASNGQGGIGGLDIYRLTKNRQGEWAKVRNMGYPINTVKDDFGLIWNKDKSIGYFASNRPGGHGSDDIYSIFNYSLQLRGIVYDKRTHERIPGAEIELLQVGRFIDDDETGETGSFAFNTVGPKEYIVTARADGYGSESRRIDMNGIYYPAYGYVEIPLLLGGPDLSFDPENPVWPSGSSGAGGPSGPGAGGNYSGPASGPSTWLDPDAGSPVSVLVLNKEDRQPLPNASVKVENNCTGQIRTLYTDFDGYITFPVGGDCTYELLGRKYGFTDDDDRFAAAEIEDFSLPARILELERLRAGMTIELKNIYYDFDMDYIREDGVPDLDHLAGLLTNYPQMQIQIGSHTDARGTDDYNADLSQRRAQAVVDYLIRSGISADRLIARGYGESRLRNACGNGIECSDDAHQYNRRTEFTIVHLGEQIRSRDKLDIPVNTWKPAE